MYDYISVCVYIYIYIGVGPRLVQTCTTTDVQAPPPHCLQNCFTLFVTSGRDVEAR